MKERIKSIIDRLLDYRIVGEYYEAEGNGHYRKKYVKKYFLRKKGE